MPGISDRRALVNAVIDSISIPGSTEARLSSRGVTDAKSAVRLRVTELELFKRWEPDIFDKLSRESKTCLVKKYAGNHYYYIFGLFVLKLCKDKDFIMNCRSKRVAKQYQIGAKLLEVKLPEKEFHMAITSLPEGYQRVHNIYIALRSLYDQMMSMFSNCGKNRGRLQSLNTKNKASDDFAFKLAEWLESEEQLLAKEGKSSYYTDKLMINRRRLMSMARISDLIYIDLIGPDDSQVILLTSNHFERCANLIKQISNILLGTLLAYGQEGNYYSEEIVNDIIDYLKVMYKIGIKDDLGVGEAGKAVTDLYKAKLSQTDELPWNNYQMMMKTYSENRQVNAGDLWSEFCTFKHDPDIMLNMSYVWKTAAQPDSSIRDDFVELVEGLSKPNPITPNAPGMIEVAIRRAVLVGAIRENRQVAIEPDEGVTIAPELKEAVSHSFPSERHLRLVTHGMLSGVKVYVPNVFPSPFDVSHLMFKDKSSALESESIRSDINLRGEAQEEIIRLEDDSIRENAELAAEVFLKRIQVTPTKSQVKWSMKSTANDILTSLDEKMSEVFKSAERKYKLITKTLSEIRDRYGGPSFTRELLSWAKENPDALINTATEPKYGEVHKRSVRIFYMFEKGMKSFLSQFERIARVVGYYVKGAEIVKGDRARESHMNILSSAHRAGKEGVLAYQILFDLSKFSQKFNHRIIDAATKVIGELVGYPEYSQISDLFKASFLYVSSRNTDKSHVGVLGAFEGFLNFLWTNIHATVMDIALRECGRSGDLAAYSDDGLLMFTMNAKPDDPKSVIQEELYSIINSIKKTYADFGLDFNLGKTLISRNLAEFLGVIQYKGHRFPTWMKELCHLGVPDEIPLIRSLGQDITDVASQMAAMIKAGMPAFAASYVGYLEIFMGPGRRLIDIAAEARASMRVISQQQVEIKTIILICCLNQSFGGVRVPDPFTSMMTADFDPTSEMIYDLKRYCEVFGDVTGIPSYLLSKVASTNDYTSLFLGAAPVHTEGISYSSGGIRSRVAQEIRKKINVPPHHPLSRRMAPNLHTALEGINNIYLPSIMSITRYIVPSILYEKVMAPTKSSSVARLLRKSKIRMIQRYDSVSMRNQMVDILQNLYSDDMVKMPSADDLYRLSYPRLSFSHSLPSCRDIAKLSYNPTPISYDIEVRKLGRLDNKGSKRFLNQDYYDDLVPPLVTTDVNIQHLMNAPDLISHCMRGIYSELISSSSQGHDLSSLVRAVCELNKCPLLFPQVLTPLQDMRKIAVANRKKSIHRVYWSESVKNAITLTRMGQLNHYMSSASNFHYSLIVTAVLARSHFLLTGTSISKRRAGFYYTISRDLIEKTKLLPMTLRENLDHTERQTYSPHNLPPNVVRAIKNEVVRTVDSTRQELVDNLLIGRMGMLPDFQRVTSGSSVLDPLRYALVWSLISKIDSMADGSSGVTGVTASIIHNSPIENTPIELVNLAVIYRAYKNVRKSSLNSAMKILMANNTLALSNTDYDLLPANIADETLNAASQLGLMTSLDRNSLRAPWAALTYHSMLVADGINMIYYSLDSRSETEASEKISPARVNAMRRITDAVISQVFIKDQEDLETDLCKIVLMVIRGSMRGSVHRSEAYNHGVAVRWLAAFAVKVEEFVSNLPLEFRRIHPRSSSSYPRYKSFPPDLLETFERYLRTEITNDSDYEKGAIDQYDMLIKFLIKLASWGYIPSVFTEETSNLILLKLSDVYETMVKPAIMMARTVSYNTVNKVLRSQVYTPEESHGFQSSIELAIDQLTEGCTEDDTFNDFLTHPPNYDYRDGDGPLTSLRIGVNFPRNSPLDLGSSLCYSLALPLLFASGRTSVSQISVLGNGGFHSDMEVLEKSLSETSLPINSNGVKLAIIYGLSESELWFSLNSWVDSHDDPTLVSVEIPPDASQFSLGVIGFLTSQHYSYATVAISSDLQGASIYVVALVEDQIPKFQTIGFPQNRNVCSLGDGALCRHMWSLNHGNAALLSALYLSPLHQAGIPVDSHFSIAGEIAFLSVEEELLDRHRVSFVESAKVSKSSQLYASLSHDVSAMVIRCHRMKIANNYSYVNVVASFVYFVKALLPGIDMDKLTRFTVDLFNSRDSESDQNYALKHLAAPVVSMKTINPCSFPSMAQINERLIPDLDLDDLSCFQGAESYAKNILNQSGVDVLDENERGLLLTYIRHHRDDLDPAKAWLVMISNRPDPQRRLVHRGRAVSEARRFRESNTSEIDLQREAAKKDAIKFLEREEVIQTKELFQGTFGESVLGLDLEVVETMEDKRNALRARLIEDKLDDFTIAMVDKLSDEEICRLSVLDLESLEDTVMEMAEDERDKLVADFGVRSYF